MNKQRKKNKPQMFLLFNLYIYIYIQILSFEIAENEAAIIYFIYNYFKYVYIDTVCLKKDSLAQFWGIINNFLKAFQLSKTPSTVLWLLELVLLLCRKYSPKEIVSD